MAFSSNVADVDSFFAFRDVAQRLKRCIENFRKGAQYVKHATSVCIMQLYSLYH